MRLAFILESPLGYGGGVSMVVRTLMEGLPKAYQFVLVSRDAEGHLSQDPLFRRIDKHISWQGEKGPPHPEFYQTRNQVLGRLVAAKPDLVHFHSGGVYSWGNRWPGASWPAYLKKENIRSLWTNHLVVDRLHGFCGENKPRFFKELIWPLAWRAKEQQIAAVEREICVSDENCLKMRTWFPAQTNKIIRLYHSRIDAKTLGPSADQPREKIILAMGHLAIRKGQHILTHAFCRLAEAYPDWQLVLVGPGDKEGCGALIRGLACEQGLSGRVRMVGQQENVADWLRRCSIFVQPSFQEGLPLALQEAMAAGCPVLATLVAGNPELVADGKNGFLVEAGNISALKDRLQWLMDHPLDREKMGREGVQRIRELGMTRQSMIRAHDELYRKVAEGNSR